MKTGTFLRESVLFFSIIPGLLDAYLFFGKEQYTCSGGRTAVQADLRMYLPTGEGDCL